GPRSRFFLKILCDVTAYRGEYERTRLDHGSVVDRLERLWSFICRAGKPRAIESAVTVIINDLLTVCVSKSESAVTGITSKLLSVFAANLCKIYCSCYMCYVFSCIFVNNP
ncbi:hypothetical protein AVEN_256042-1, partial [Araneus ventricosus]